MTVLAVTSLKHSPGVTTFGIALTMALAQDGLAAVYVDADPSGGDAAAYVGLPADPGVVSLAAACRHPEVRPDLAPHVKGLPSGGWAVLSPGDPGQASAAVAALAGRLSAALASVVDNSVIDCGRLFPASPALPIVESADRTLLLMRPTLAGVDHVASQAAWLDGLTRGRVGLVLLGRSPYDSDEVASATGLRVEGFVPIDTRGANGVSGSLTERAARRTQLGRAARSIADRLTADTHRDATLLVSESQVSGV